MRLLALYSPFPPIPDITRERQLGGGSQCALGWRYREPLNRQTLTWVADEAERQATGQDGTALEEPGMLMLPLHPCGSRQSLRNRREPLRLPAENVEENKGQSSLGGCRCFVAWEEPHGAAISA